MNFKTVSVLVILSLLGQQVHVEAALTCRGCELTSNQTCDFAYKCDDQVDYCETLISKVDGQYSLIFGCGIDKCKEYGKNSTNAGLDKCDFNDPNTECWSCCGSDKCNILNNAFAVLPKDAFSSSSVTTEEKTTDFDSEDWDDLEDLEEKKFLKKIGEDMSREEEAISIEEKRRKFKTLSFMTTVTGNASSDEMTSTMRTTTNDDVSIERLISTLDVSKATNGTTTSFISTTEVTLNSTIEEIRSTAGVESSNDIEMLKSTVTKAPNSQKTTYESIHDVTHQPFKSSASMTTITIPLFLITIITFLNI